MLAAIRGHRKLSEKLLGLTQQLEGVEWTVDGVTAHAKKRMAEIAAAHGEAEGEEGGGSEAVVVGAPEEPDDDKAGECKAKGDDAFRWV